MICLNGGSNVVYNPPPDFSLPVNTDFKTVEEYLATQPKGTQKLLRELRTVILALAPEAVESISYGMPAYKLAGKPLVYFAGFARHIGFYPTPSAVAAFEKELAPYQHAKGSVQFPLDDALPMELIKKIIAFRAAEIL